LVGAILNLGLKGTSFFPFLIFNYSRRFQFLGKVIKLFLLGDYIFNLLGNFNQIIPRAFPFFRRKGIWKIFLGVGELIIIRFKLPPNLLIKG